jgi:hypothetical protein
MEKCCATLCRMSACIRMSESMQRPPISPTAAAAAAAAHLQPRAEVSILVNIQLQHINAIT